MNIIIPPGVFYIVGVLLILGGAWRTVRLGRAVLPEAGEGEEAAARRARAVKDRKRHMVMGIVWVGMGLFMLFSASGVLPRLLNR